MMSIILVILIRRMSIDALSNDTQFNTERIKPVVPNGVGFDCL